jgi:hypothetical protein
MNLWLESRALRAGVIAALLLGLGMAWQVAMAATIVVTWTQTTSRDDGTPLPASEVAGHKIEYGTCASDGVWGTLEGEVFVASPALTVTIEAPGYGAKCVRGYTRDTAGIESVASNVAWKFYPTSPPNPPVIAVAGATAYELKMLGNGEIRLGRDIGTLKQNTVCDETQWVAPSYHGVPLDAVAAYRMPKSSVVVASCAPQS